MVSEDDYRRDTFPLLSLSQVLRIAPHLLVLRTCQTPTPLRLATSHNDYSFCDCAWGFPRESRSLVAPRREHRKDPIPHGGAGVDSLGAQIYDRGDDRSSLHSLGAQEPCGGTHERASRGCKTALGWSAEGGPRHPIFPWCVHILFPPSSNYVFLNVEDRGLFRRRIYFSS